MARSDTGKLIVADDGTVIGYNETGLILTLPDGSIRQLSARPGEAAWRDPAILGDIDAWGLREQGDWLTFEAQLPAYPHPRRFRVPLGGGDPVADAPGPLIAVLSLGGARRAWALPGPPGMVCHVLSLADDIGAVGMGADGTVPVTEQLEHLRERTVDALAGEMFLARRQGAGRALPLVAVRAETSDVSLPQQGEGAGWRNLQVVIANLVKTAQRLGVALRIPTIMLDFGPEDVTTPPAHYIAACHDLMDRIDGYLASLGVQAPRFLMRADETGQRTGEHWHLAVHPGNHDLCFVGPGNAVGWSETRRPTETGMHMLAAMEAMAIEAALDGQSWNCPRLLLAEAAGATTIRVTCAADAPLVLGEGAHGFALSTGRSASAQIASVDICSRDDRTVLVHLDQPITGGMTLSYAHGQRGALRDSHRIEVPGVGISRRWALPAILAVTV